MSNAVRIVGTKLEGPMFIAAILSNSQVASLPLHVIKLRFRGTALTSIVVTHNVSQHIANDVRITKFSKFCRSHTLSRFGLKSVILRTSTVLPFTNCIKVTLLAPGTIGPDLSEAFPSDWIVILESGVTVGETDARVTVELE